MGILINEKQNVFEIITKNTSYVFGLDDGWFGERNSINNGLGDWYVNRENFLNDLNPLIDEVKNDGMKFGIWLETEVVNPLSKLYKDNPDWIVLISYQIEIYL